MKDAVIFDVDGTLADVSSILHYIVKHKSRDTEHFKKDFHSFHEESIDVPPHEEVAAEARQLHADGLTVLVVTARMEEWRPQTELWLEKHNIPYEKLYMRPQNDYRPDYEVKKDILAEITAEGYWVIAAWDDNPKIIALWQENGIPTEKVGDWDGS